MGKLLRLLKLPLSTGASAAARLANSRPLRAFWESLLWGGEGRERFLLKLLQLHYSSRYRRDWELGGQPHFFNQRLGLFNAAFTDTCFGMYPYTRGFFASEVIRDGDRLLDIGCGDGFFTRRFLAPRCSRVDAIDIEPTAIAAARKANAAPHICYALLDAVAQPFPSPPYDVIVWDGAIGHFPPGATQAMLGKISEALAPGGIFVGSESLGNEGHDHLQFFPALADLLAQFAPCFRHVEGQEVRYRIGRRGEQVRQEAYWRCGNDPARLEQARWRSPAELALVSGRSAA